jgi:hypothetical protein
MDIRRRDPRTLRSFVRLDERRSMCVRACVRAFTVLTGVILLLDPPFQAYRETREPLPGSSFRNAFNTEFID